MFNLISRQRLFTMWALLLLIVFLVVPLVAFAQAAVATAAPSFLGMSHQDWVSLLAPAVAALVVAVTGAIIAVVSGLWKLVKAWLIAHHQAAFAQAIASAGAVIQPALQTGASAIAAKISAGQLDYTDKAALTAEAEREVSLVEARVPAMIAIAAPAAGSLVASLVSKVDATQVQLAAAAAAPSAVDGIVAAAKTLSDVRAALDAVPSPAAISSAPASAAVAA